MILEISSLTTLAHILFGTIAVAAGATAIAVKKGATMHIKAGRTFVYSMGFSSLLGAILGLLKPESFYITFHAGILGCTLIASSWLSARAGTSDQLGKAAMTVGSINIINTVTLIILGLKAQSLPSGMIFGFQAGNYFFLSGMAGLAVIGDIILISRKTISERYRISRHLWRMCLAFFIAAGSAFTGPGAKAFPEMVRKSGVLAIPELLILLLMLFWLARTLFWTYRIQRTRDNGSILK